MLEYVGGGEADRDLAAADVEAAAQRDRLAAAGEIEVVVAALRQRVQSRGLQDHRPVSLLVAAAELERGKGVAVERRSLQLHHTLGIDRVRRVPARRLTEEESSRRDRQDCSRDQERRALAAARAPGEAQRSEGFLGPLHGLELRAELGWRTGGDQ